VTAILRQHIPDKKWETEVRTAPPKYFRDDAPDRPNIVYILADDFGYGGLARAGITPAARSSLPLTPEVYLSGN